MKDLVKVCVRYGAVAGVLSVILLIILYYSGRNPMLIAPFLDFRIFVLGIFIFFSLKEFRDAYQGGLLYFWQGLFGSFVVVVLSSTISSIHNADSSASSIAIPSFEMKSARDLARKAAR